MASIEENFGISHSELKELMSRRRDDAVALINERGGLDEIARQLRTDLQRGISTQSREDLNSRRSYYGVNRLPHSDPLRKSFVRMVWESLQFALQDRLLLMFIMAAILSMILGLAIEQRKEYAWLEGAVILVPVLIIVIITALHGRDERRQFEHMYDIMTDKPAVIRDGKVQQISPEDLVVGDIVQISSDSDLPTDGLLIQGNNISVDESNLTGEADLIIKDNNRDPVLLAGTRVMAGEGTMLVTAVGPHSQQGAGFAILTQMPKDEGAVSRLCSCIRDWLRCKTENADVAYAIFSRLKVLLWCGIAAALICLLALSLWFTISELIVMGRSWNTSTDLSQLLQFIFIGITVIVVAIPEGIMVAVSLSYRHFIRKMNQDNNFVRHSNGYKLTGEVTSLVVEKTGVLTRNQFAVVESYFAGNHYTANPKQDDLPDNLLEVLKLTISVNTDYNSKLESNVGRKKAKQVRNVTECALLSFLKQLGVDYETIREQYPMERIVKIYPLKVATKNRSTVIHLSGGSYRILTTGAAETVLQNCTQVLNESGKVSSLGDDNKREILETVIHRMSSSAQRVVALAYRDFPIVNNTTPDWDDADDVISYLTLIGITGIQDPLKPEVPDCINSCQQAGITVRMVTGDNIRTARAIAEKCGIIRMGDDHLVLDRKEFNRKVTDMNGYVVQQKLDRIWPQLRVVAGCSPTDKYNLLSLCDVEKCKEVVAFVGKGTNDAPAIKRADVGIAMGSERTDIAEGVCDIVVHSDDFSSVVKAVMHSRNISASISRFLQFQLTVNIVAVLLTVIASVTIGHSPLKAIHLLWVNLIMDVLAALALSMEPPTIELLKRKPYGKKKPLISKQMWVFLVGHSIYQLMILLVILFAGPTLFNIDNGAGRGPDPSQHFTLIFNTFVMFQLFNEINARKIHGERNVFSGLWRNWVFMVIMIIQIIIQMIVVQFGGEAFCTSGLNLDLGLWCIFLGGTELLIGQLLTLIPLHFPHQFSSTVDVSDPITDDNTSTRARLLWLKSVNRLRTQIRVVNAFRAGIDVHGSMENITWQTYHYRNIPVTGIETTV